MMPDPVFKMTPWILLPWMAAPPVLAQAPEPLDLAGAVAEALRNNRALQAARLRIEEAEGDLVGASVLLKDNPDLELSAGPRVSGAGGETWADLDVGIAQRFEIGGQRGRRIRAANERILAARAGARDAERVVSLAVATLFFESLAAREKERVLAQDERLAADLVEVARVRLEAGAGGPFELNAAQIALARAGVAVRRARAEAEATRVRLAEVLGRPPGDRFDPRGEIAMEVPPGTTEDLVETALRARSDLLALRHEVNSARARAALAGAEAWPDLTVGAAYGRDEGDHVAAFRVGLPIPLFQRNQGERARAVAEAARVEAELEALRLAIEGEVRGERARYAQAAEALGLFEADLVTAQEENATLLVRLYEGGKVAYPEVALVRREIAETRLAYLDARLEAVLAAVRLRAAVGMDVAGQDGGTR